MEKRGLSTVVTTVIMILLVLVAIGVVWVVVRNLIGSGEEKIDIGQKCVTTLLEIDSVSCVSGTCSLSVKKLGGYAINGINIVFSNSTSSGNTLLQSGDISVLKTFSLTPGVGSPTKVSLSAYFNDTAGQAVNCPQIVQENI